MVKKLLRKIRRKWHNDIIDQYNDINCKTMALQDQYNDINCKIMALQDQYNDINCKTMALQDQYNDINCKIMALMKQVLQGKPEDELSFLFDMYGSDKGLMHNHTVHTFTDTYYLLFSPIRDEVKAVFECGILNGASLRAWRDYFKNATIVGGDINKKSLFEEDRIHTALLDQMDDKSIRDFFSSLSSNYPVDFDIIIDDGCHIYEATICLFENSINHLKPNGIYIIEDMLERYFPRYQEYFKRYSEKIRVGSIKI